MSLISNTINQLKRSAPEEIPGLVTSLFSQLDPRMVEIVRQDLFLQASLTDLALKRAVNENPSNAWKWYVRENCANVQKGYYGQGPDLNERFGKTCHAAVLQQLQNLRAGKKITLTELYDIYAKVRHQLAVESQTLDADKFGKKRVEGESNYSPLTRGFAPYVANSQRYYLEAVKGLTPIKNDNHFFKQALKLLSNPEQYRVYELRVKPSEPPCFVVVHQNPGEEPTLTYVLTTSEIENREIEILSGISYSPAGWMINARCFGMAAFTINGSDPFIQHCTVKRIDPYFKLGEKLFQQILEPSTYKKETQDQIAELETLLDNAMGTTRGNSSITGMIIVTLLLLHDFLVTPCKDKIYSDLEALTLPRDEFIKKFPSYRMVNLSFTVSAFMRKVIRKLGSLEAYNNLPLFTHDARPYIGPTDYPQNIYSSAMTAPIMRFSDGYREFILIKSSSTDPHIFFQRYPGGILWCYISPTGLITPQLKDMPLALFKRV
jgi:hypothetical protein